MATDSLNDLLTTDEAAKFLKISAARVKQLSLAGKIGKKIGRQLVFSRRELAAFAKIDRPVGNPNLKKHGRLKP